MSSSWKYNTNTFIPYMSSSCKYIINTCIWHVAFEKNWKNYLVDFCWIQYFKPKKTVTLILLLSWKYVALEDAPLRELAWTYARWTLIQDSFKTVQGEMTLQCSYKYFSLFTVGALTSHVHITVTQFSWSFTCDTHKMEWSVHFYQLTLISMKSEHFFHS